MKLTDQIKEMIENAKSEEEVKTILENVKEGAEDAGLILDDEDLDNEMIDLFELNINDAEVDVNIDENKISVSSSKYIKGVFGKIINVNGFRIESYYESTILDDEE